MNDARFSHACGIVNKNEILVAGGKDGHGNALQSVEIFSLIISEWRESGILPEPLSSIVSIQLDSTVIVIGDTGIYHFDETAYDWYLRDETLPSERSEYIAMPLSGKLMKCKFRFSASIPTKKSLNFQVTHLKYHILIKVKWFHHGHFGAISMAVLWNMAKIA